MKDKGILQIFAGGIRQTLVTVYDVGQRMTGTGDAFPAGIALAVEELSFRLLGEHFDAYEERVRAALRDQQIDALAAEFEQVMENEVLEGRCELVIGADGTKRYSPHELALKIADQQQAGTEEIAQKFHEAYERLAPQFGYKTREASAKPWAEVPINNRDLMTAVCAEIFPAESSRAAREELAASQKLSGELAEALRKLKSYNVAIAAEHINYRPEDHIGVAESALKKYDAAQSAEKGGEN